MYTASLRKVGGSVMLAVPPAILDLLHLHADNLVGLSVDHGRLIVEPSTKPRYTLDELLAQCDPSAKMGQEDKDWTQSNKPIGRELI